MKPEGLKPETINSEIAEKVMGWYRVGMDWYAEVKWTGFNDGRYSSLCFNPYRRIDHAWMVVEKITQPPRTPKESEKAANSRFGMWFETAHLWACTAEEASKSICLAALEAVKEVKS